jgi:hypothetical protein
MKRYKSNSKGFTRTAMRTHPTNGYMPLRGGIRL